MVVTTGLEEIAKRYGGFIPLINYAWHLSCSLDILLLKRTEPDRVIESGDLDGRLKTLIDALKLPKVQDYREGPENPLYCLVEDDELISEVKVLGDLLLPAEDQLISFGQENLPQNQALAVIHVTVLTEGLF